MITKLPLFINTSHHDTIPDWSKIDPKPLLCITKATEGSTFRDATMPTFMAEMKKNGIHRGVFHFHRKAVSESAQALNFINYVRDIIEDDDIIVLDVEEGGETAQQLMDWYILVMAEFPRNKFWIYSRKNILDPIPMFLRSVISIFNSNPVERDLFVYGDHPLNAIQMNADQRTFFRTQLDATWTAGYPYNPDLYSSVPAAYVPDQTKWPVVKAWQYSDKGQITGISSAVDLDWMSPELVSELGEAPNDDVVTEPYIGVKHIEGVRNGWKFFLQVIDPNLVVYATPCPATRQTVSSIAIQFDADIGTNGGEWDRITGLLKDYSVDDRRVVVGRKEPVPSLMVLSNGDIVIDHKNVANVEEAVSGLRYLIQNRQIKTYLYGSEPQYTEGHSRTIECLTADGKHIQIVSEGVYPNQGLKLHEVAELALEYGAVVAFDSGGGGDSTMYMDGKVLNVPENIDNNGQNVERRLPQVKLIFAQKNGDPMPTIGTAKEALGNVAVIRETPSRYGKEITRIPAYSTVEFVEKVPVVPQGTADKDGEMWLKLADGQSYVNWRLYSNGVLKDYFTIIQEPETPPVEPPVSSDIPMTLSWDETDTHLGGSVSWVVKAK